MTSSVSGRAACGVLRRAAAWSVPSVYLLFTLVLIAATVGVAVRIQVLAVGLVLFALLALAFAVAAATRSTLSRRTRTAWWLLSTGFLLLNLVPVGMNISDGGLGAAHSGIATPPTYGDLLRLLAVLPMLAALITFPRSNTTARDTHKMVLDVVIVAGSSFMVIWYFVLGPVTTARLPVLTMVVAAAYPIGDLALIFGAAVVVVRGSHAAVRRPIAILLSGLALLVVADTYLSYCKLHPDNAAFPMIQLTVLMTGLFLISLAGLEQCLRAAGGTTGEVRRRPSTYGTWLPYVALIAGYGLLVAESLRSGLYPWGGLILGSGVMIVAGAVRQFLAMRENHELITHDSLTGLANRVRLHEGLARAVAQANRTGTRAAVMLIDMNGFKQVNDTLGHDAGDQLLIGFAKLLTDNVLGGDTVARLGGDEFAVVLHSVGTDENVSAVAARLIAGMQEPIAVNGEPVCPSACIGIAITEPGRPAIPAELLNQADAAMYRAKAQPGSSYRFHVPDVAVNRPA